MTVLNYHSVRNNGELPLSVAVRSFRWQMQHIANKGYRCVSLEEGFYKENEKDRRTIPLTFDDGYLDNYTEAFPILLELGFTATFFVTAEFIEHRMIPWHKKPGQGEAMSWGNLREMARAGMRVGSHTLSHSRLSEIPAAEAMRELVESRVMIEQCLGAQVLSFAYPSGDFTKEVMGMVPEAGYAMAAALALPPGLMEDRYSIPRMGISVRDGRWRYRLKISGAFCPMPVQQMVNFRQRFFNGMKKKKKMEKLENAQKMHRNGKIRGKS